MPRENLQRTPFDEQAALEELERIRRSIEGYRRQRREVLDEFDRFTRSFRIPAAEPALPDPAPAARGAAVEERPEVASAVSPPERAPLEVLASISPEDAPSTGVEASQSAKYPSMAPVLEQQADEQPPAERPRRVRRAVALGFVTVLLALGVVFSRSWRSTPSEPAVPAPATAAPAPAVPGRNTPASPGPPVAAPLPGGIVASGIQAELTTLRRVWVRVLVDGERTVERELQAGVRIPLRAERTIAIRTGDAGAVQLVVDGRSQGPLGRDGEVVTRTFAARPPAKR